MLSLDVVGLSEFRWPQANDRKPVETFIIYTYMSMSTYEDNEVERVYEEIKEVLKEVKGTDNLILLGDCKAMAREGRIVGKYGRRKRNEHGDRLVESYAEHKLVIANTFTKNKKRRKHTWRMPRDIAMYKID